MKRNQDLILGDKVFVVRHGDCVFQMVEDYGHGRCMRYTFSHDFDGHTVRLHADPTALAGSAYIPDDEYEARLQGPRA